MPTIDEIARSLTGAWELFLDRADAMRRFDVSVEGFWRSFAAVFLVAPSYVFAVLADARMAAGSDPLAPVESGTGMIVHNGIGLLVDWIALPLILALLARPLGISRHYSAFIVARNWSAVIAAIPFGLIGLLIVSGLVNQEFGSILMLAALFLVLRYNFIVARRALDAGVGFAIGIVVLDFVVSLTLALAIDGVFAPQ
ncbi:MAG: hypothetical protein J0H08_02160 [Rhizobiales bacterium]|nr:hypothetical protein [Hyphomicrobiales bacterium]